MGATTTTSDTDLIAKCARAVAAELQWRAEASADEGNRPPVTDEYDDLLAEITDTEAETEEGNRAKLSVALAVYAPALPVDAPSVDGLLWDAIIALALPLPGMPVDAQLS